MAVRTDALYNVVISIRKKVNHKFPVRPISPREQTTGHVDGDETARSQAHKITTEEQDESLKRHGWLFLNSLKKVGRVI